MKNLFLDTATGFGFASMVSPEDFKALLLGFGSAIGAAIGREIVNFIKSRIQKRKSRTLKR
jgi:uncharacterized membrane protein YfcA